LTSASIIPNRSPQTIRLLAAIIESNIRRNPRNKGPAGVAMILYTAESCPSQPASNADRYRAAYGQHVDLFGSSGLALDLRCGTGLRRIDTDDLGEGG
jgi:hypothetical protein